MWPAREFACVLHIIRVEINAYAWLVQHLDHEKGFSVCRFTEASHCESAQCWLTVLSACFPTSLLHHRAAGKKVAFHWGFLVCTEKKGSQSAGSKCLSYSPGNQQLARKLQSGSLSEPPLPVNERGFYYGGSFSFLRHSLQCQSTLYAICRIVVEYALYFQTLVYGKLLFTILKNRSSFHKVKCRR